MQLGSVSQDFGDEAVSEVEFVQNREWRWNREESNSGCLWVRRRIRSLPRGCGLGERVIGPERANGRAPFESAKGWEPAGDWVAEATLGPAERD